MSNFPIDMFDAQAPQGAVRFTCTGFRIRSPHDLVLVMRHAGFSNEAYAQARRLADLKLQAFGDHPPLAAQLDVLIPVYAQTVVTGWEHVNGADGKPVPYSPIEGEALLRALAHKNADVVLRAIYHAQPADNFRPLVEGLGNG